jgi:putative ABC transport system permease protein
MSGFGQIRSITAINLRSVPARFGTSMVVVVGVAVVVAVVISALAVATGFKRAAMATGDPSRAVILSGTTESESSLSRENVATIIDAPGIEATVERRALASAEVLVFPTLINQRTRLNAFAALRGVGAEAFTLRPEIKITEGRMFSGGSHEVVVGIGVRRRLGGLEVGSSIPLPNGDWQVVGVFESEGDSHESELITDAETLLDAYQRNDFNSVTVAIDGNGGLHRLNAALESNPTLTATVQREDEYFTAQSRSVATLLTLLAYGIGGIVAFGAVFGALNTMYSAVSTRTTEIATLRALGFGAVPVVVSVLIEALLLGLAGALLGALFAWIALDGSTISTMTGTTPSQLTFGLVVTPPLVLIGVAFAVAISCVGGLFAAVRAAYVPVAMAMRLN